MKEERTSLNIHQKILKIADAAGILRKTKEGFNYKYVPEEAIQAKVTGGMQKYGVMLYHGIVPGTFRVTPYQYTKWNKKLNKDETINELIVQADTYYLWVNTDNPSDTMKVDWILCGQMEDVSQAFGGAETYCNRYFLMKSLQLATSELDPDAYRSEQKKAASYEQDKALSEAVKEVVATGTDVIKLCGNKDIVKSIVSKYNGGNSNPSAIKSFDICNSIMAEFRKIMEEHSKK